MPFRASPVADLQVTSGVAGSSVVIDGSASRGAIKRWSLDFGDGDVLSDVRGRPEPVEHTYQSPGSYIVVLTVVDNQGNDATERKTLLIEAAVPVDCVLSDWQMESAGEWTPCVDGTQTREETWVRTVVTEPAHGGAPCGSLSEVRVATQPCTPPPPPPTGGNFDELAARPDCVSAIRMASQAEIDAVNPRSKPYDPVAQKKRPVEYDPVLNAAKLTVHPPESTDTQQKWWPIEMLPGNDMFLMWDYRFDEHWAYQVGYIIRTKAYQMNGPNGAPWFTFRAFFTPVPSGYVLELTLNSNSSNLMFPGYSSRGNKEAIEPRIPGSNCYVKANEWAREAVYVKDLGPTTPYTDVFYTLGDGTQISVAEKWPGGRVVEISRWWATESAGPTQVLNKVRVVQPYADGLKLSRLEFDTGIDQAPAQDKMLHSWQRQLICLKNPPEEVNTGALVTRP